MLTNRTLRQSLLPLTWTAWVSCSSQDSSYRAKQRHLAQELQKLKEDLEKVEQLQVWLLAYGDGMNQQINDGV